MDYLKNKKVYLSGPIEFDEGNWREPVIEKLQSHFETMKNVRMQDLFANEPTRAEKMHL